jgi:hypothetical protein
MILKKKDITLLALSLSLAQHAPADKQTNQF